MTINTCEQAFSMQSIGKFFWSLYSIHQIYPMLWSPLWSSLSDMMSTSTNVWQLSKKNSIAIKLWARRQKAESWLLCIPELCNQCYWEPAAAVRAFGTGSWSLRRVGVKFSYCTVLKRLKQKRIQGQCWCVWYGNGSTWLSLSGLIIRVNTLMVLPSIRTCLNYWCQ